MQMLMCLSLVKHTHLDMTTDYSLLVVVMVDVLVVVVMMSALVHLVIM